MKKNLRQGLVTTPKELMRLGLKFLTEEHIEPRTKILVNIRNKEGLSDTWSFEK